MNKMTRFFKFPSSICTPEFTTKIGLIKYWEILKKTYLAKYLPLCVFGLFVIEKALWKSEKTKFVKYILMDLRVFH